MLDMFLSFHLCFYKALHQPRNSQLSTLFPASPDHRQTPQSDSSQCFLACPLQHIHDWQAMIQQSSMLAKWTYKTARIQILNQISLCTLLCLQEQKCSHYENHPKHQKTDQILESDFPKCPGINKLLFFQSGCFFLVPAHKYQWRTQKFQSKVKTHPILLQMPTINQKHIMLHSLLQEGWRHIAVYEGCASS